MGGRPISIYRMRSAFVVGSIEDLRKQLKNKASQCAGVDAALVVAVLSCTAFAGTDEMEQALVGTRATEHQLDQGSMRTYRRRDGYWHPGPPQRGAQISAVMFTEDIRASRIVYDLPSVWVSPRAARPLPFHLPLETRTAKDNGEVFLAAEATASADTVFELPSDWPGFADLG
ncbi:MAG: hypothetical protein QOF66_2571 [Mycobacterium sp.]|jgi:hypothetical protein|nr:hypothetical protein [Mycobacterium sp.]